VLAEDIAALIELDAAVALVSWTALVAAALFAALLDDAGFAFLPLLLTLVGLGRFFFDDAGSTTVELVLDVVSDGESILAGNDTAEADAVDSDVGRFLLLF